MELFEILKQVAIHAVIHFPRERVTHYGVNKIPFLKKDRQGLVRLPRKIDGIPIKQKYAHSAITFSNGCNSSWHILEIIVV